MTADMLAEPVLCSFCGEPELVELFEMWGHEFMWSTCCESLHHSLVEEVNADPAWGRELLRRLGAEAYAGHRLRRLADDGGCGLVLDWQLELRPVSFAQARSFVGRYHAHCGMPTAWRFGQAIFNGQTMVGVVTAGNPVARAYNGRGIVEVNRLCVRRDVASALRWNAASQLLGWAARTAEQRGFSSIISYTRADEPCTSLTAAGYVREAVVRGRSWHSARRRRRNTNALVDKVRWSRALRPRTAKVVKPNQAEPPAIPDWMRVADDGLCYTEPTGLLAKESHPCPCLP